MKIGRLDMLDSKIVDTKRKLKQTFVEEEESVFMN